MAEHAPYHNDFLDDTFCQEDGEYWPCIAHRLTVTCKCSHTQANHGHGGTGECWSLACGCVHFRLRVAA